MTISLLIYVTSIALQLVAVYLAFRLIQKSGWHLAWSLIATALLLMAMRRIISFFHFIESGEPLESLLPELVALTISLLMVVGVARMGALFKINKEAVSALTQSEQRYRELFDSSEVAIINQDLTEIYRSMQNFRESGVLDIREYLSNNNDVAWELVKKIRVKKINRAGMELFGTTSEYELSQDVSKIFNLKTIDVFVDELCAIWNQDRFFRSEVEINRFDGGSLSCILSMPIPVAEQGFKNIAVSVLDISEHKRAEEQLLQKEKELHQAQKMDALGKLTGGIAHDFNNMLGIILGYTELLSMGLKRQPALGKYVSEIDSAAQRSAKLTKKLLSFSTQKQQESQIVNIYNLLKDNQHMLEKVLTARIQLDILQNGTAWNVYLDPGDLQDAIINMCINSMHAMESGGKLSLIVSNHRVTDDINGEINLKPGDYVRLSVIDTGIGMDEAIRAQLFEPFFTTKKEMGTGMGLSQVYGFVRRSGGEISIQSQPGKGARFDIYFPRYFAIEKMEPPQVAYFENFRGSETILVVDDEPSLCYLAKEIFEEEGYRVFTAENGNQALKILAEEEIDLMLSDVIMPEMDGFELAYLVNERYPNVVIQLVSGYGDEKKIHSIHEDLAKDLLSKPVKSEQLLRRIRKLLDVQSRARRRPQSS